MSLAEKPPAAETDLAEVWGDIVSRRQLAISLVIGGAVSIAFYFTALRLLTGIGSTPAIDRALAMLVGIVGCLVGGFICAQIFKPKRHLSEDADGSDAWRMEILQQIESEEGEIGDARALPAVVQQEMKEVGLFDLFDQYHQNQLKQKAH
ncbi:hypothetical protein ACT6QG_15825 [Xanthobacter sp. TB0136]|uniref:hypothetical protein n=1 Tax=Xanthobacter sp. TB0136 TaxID=3459177 RepID=UPI00403A5BA7